MPSGITSHQRKTLLAAAAVATTLALGSAAHADNIYWDSGGGADTNWSNPANWNLSGVNQEPGISDKAFLNNGGTINITDTGNLVTGFIVGASGDSSLDPNNLGLGGTVNFNGGELETGPFIGSADIGVGTTSVNVWNHNSGTLFANELVRFGVAAGSSATLNMSGGTIDVTRNIPAPPDNTPLNFFLIGDEGNGTLKMTGGTIKSLGLFSVALQPHSTSTMTMSAGTIQSGDCIIAGNSDIPNKFGAKATVNFSGGSMTVAGMRLSDSAFATSVMNQSGTASLKGRELLVGAWSDTTYTLSGNASIDMDVQVNVATFHPVERPEGSASEPVRTFTQSGSSTVTTGGLLVGEFGRGVYTINSGTLNVLGVARNGTQFPGNDPSFGNLIAGRNGDGPNSGRGTFTLNGGTVTVGTNIFLGDFNDGNGTMIVNGGTLTVTGNLNVGAALASNAPPDATRLEPSATNGFQGQALRVTGEFRVRGNAAAININGKLLANPADKSPYRNAPADINHGTLGFELGNNGGLSRINVAGAADLDGAVIDLGFMSSSTFVPDYNQSFDLINAASFGATGTGTTQNVGTGVGYTLAAGDAADWTLRIVTGGNGKILQAVNRVVPGDTNADLDVDFDDLVVLAQNYNLTGRTRATGDFNRSTVTDFDDLVVLAQHYNFNGNGLPPGVSADFAADWALAQAMVAPEPASLSAILGVAAIALRRRRA